MRLAASLLAVVAIGYLVLCAALFVAQRSLIYFPPPGASKDPAATLQLQVADAEVAVSVRLGTGPRALIYFGGNAEDVSASLPAFAQAFSSHAIYLLHYRGYGPSPGSPSEKAIQADALALFDHVRKSHADITLIGRSLGSGVAIQVASQRPASKLVLVTPYDSLQELAARQFPAFPVRWLLIDKFESSKHAPQVSVPTLLIAAEHDEVIPGASTAQLHARFRQGLARLAVLPGTTHNTISLHPAYLPLLRSML
jgi:pimeloyl-ACP methyl ester carboxylesterase